MASMCGGSSKSQAAGMTGGSNNYYRPGSYPYQSDYYLAPRSVAPWSRAQQQHHQSSKIYSNNKYSSSCKYGSAMLIVVTLLVLTAVFAVAGLALWMGALRTDTKNVIIGFSCTLRVTKGERYNTMLKLNTSALFKEKERKYRSLIDALFKKSMLGQSYKQTVIDKFENGTSLKVSFRLYLDRRKVPRSIANFESTIEDIITKESYSINSLFKDIELDLNSISVKRINTGGGQGQAYQSKPVPVASESQSSKNTMITKSGVLRSNRVNSSLIMSPKLNKSKTKTAMAAAEANDAALLSRAPVVQGTFTATKLNMTVPRNKQKQEEAPKASENMNSTTSSEINTTSEAQATAVLVPSEDEQSSGQSPQETSQDFRKPELETSPWKPIVGSPQAPGSGVVTATTKEPYLEPSGASRLNTKFHQEGNGGSQQQTIAPPWILGESSPSASADLTANGSGAEDTVSGVGVAEPVSDLELDLTVRSRYSDLIRSSEEPTEPQYHQVDIDKSRPVYTSYKTAELNGAEFAYKNKSTTTSAINPSSELVASAAGTSKPFRHTIPVDKISPAMIAESERLLEPSFFNDKAMVVNLTDQAVLNYAIGGEPAHQQQRVMPNKQQQLLDSFERLVEATTFIKDNAAAPGTVFRVNLPLDKSELEHTPSTSAEAKPNSTTPTTTSVPAWSRNWTFVQVDTVKHVPAGSQPAVVVSSNGDNHDHPGNRKSVYNETLKANIVQNLVTLAPAKSNSGVGRPVRLRPRPLRPNSAIVTSAPLNQSPSFSLPMRLGELGNQQNANGTVRDEIRTVPVISGGLPSTVVNGTTTRKNLEQIVEVVTSISTKVSTNIEASKVVIDKPTNRVNGSTLGLQPGSLILPATKQKPAVAETSVSDELSIALPFRDDAEFSESREMRHSHDKITQAALLEKLVKLAHVGIDKSPITARPKVGQYHKFKNSANVIHANNSQQHQRQAPPNIEELAKIAHISVREPVQKQQIATTGAEETFHFRKVANSTAPREGPIFKLLKKTFTKASDVEF